MSDATAQLFTIFAVGVVLTLVVGFYALVTTRNLIRALISVEILAKGATLLIVICGYSAGQVGLAQALAITLIVIEVAIIVVAVGVVVCIYERNHSLDAEQLQNLKG
jgi:multicomponent Na+:H+ antiporter subunit C